MASKKAAAGVDNTQRRKWDKEEYAERAREREREEEEEEEERLAPKRREPPVQRAPLQQRAFSVDLTSRLGKTQVVTQQAPLSMQAGFFCNVCQCIVKDSAVYLDHINGKKHQRALGMSMRVERSSVDQVKQRFETLKRKQAETFTEEDLDTRIRAREEEEEERRRQKKERKKDKKKSDDPVDDTGDMDPEMAALMGFGGFGSSKQT
ncbi:U4/U6.U5 tri-snRNP component SNU23 [Klebsormidium nitens]|uniref:U4/U6.U5 tri-snRNP component SNU23 n=1 Tax=Klebsormidium nitens TaxID=105231 RepID=A0A1Y1I822_KLENI|nr:U4/U6.U5 tri-snRNP component SNU23 [Klebsormidium nitens]|eukprot:GAQ87124.1 U4/U6.U5 tri-snRNP component SNU23 [Klebsormidium nitens]